MLKITFNGLFWLIELRRVAMVTVAMVKFVYKQNWNDAI